MPTWIEPKIKLLLDNYIGIHWIKNHDDPSVWQGIDKIPDIELWQTHYWLKVKLIDAIWERARLRWADGDASTSITLAAGFSARRMVKEYIEKFYSTNMDR